MEICDMAVMDFPAAMDVRKFPAGVRGEICIVT
jgi:hypothetical protein